MVHLIGAFRFTCESLFEARALLKGSLSVLPSGETLSFDAVDPDLSAAHYDGEPIEVLGGVVIYRSHRVWMELAEALGCVMCTPTRLDDGFVRFGFRKLDRDASWHAKALPSGHTEKYGVDSDFARLSKFEAPAFLESFLNAVRFAKLPDDARILSLGVHTGDELGIFKALHSEYALEAMALVGIDHSATAIARARVRFPEFRFIEADVQALDTLALGRFDLVIAINVLHSPNVDGQAVFRRLVREQLTETGAMIVGFPNSRYVDHALRFGAKVRGYHYPELSVLWKDVAAYKRYLQQQRFRVTVTGKHTVLLTARRQARRADAPRAS